MMFPRFAQSDRPLFFSMCTPFMLAMVSGATPMSNQGPMFAGQPVSLSGALREVDRADIDQDGDLDLVVVSSSTDEATILLNNGYGQFEIEAVVASPGLFDRPEGIVLTDLNADEYPDLVVANFGSNTVSVLLNDGSGTLQLPASNILVGSEPKDVSVGYIDDDEHLDIVVANSGDGEVQVLVSDGIGGYAGLIPVPAGNLVQRLELADLDLDGRTDVVAVSDQRVVVLRNQGAGVLTEIDNINMNPLGPRDVAIADFDNDSDLDMVVANNGVGATASRILFNSGNGTFDSQSDVLIGINHRCVDVLDADGDGDVDFVVGGTSDGLVHILLNNGSGAFGSMRTNFIGINPWSVISDDFDGDGNTDIVTSNRATSDLSLLLGVGDSSFHDQQVLDSGAGSVVMFVDSGDANADGYMDFAVAHDTAEGGGNVQLFVYDDVSDTYIPSFAFNAGVTPNHVLLADLTATPGLDLVVTSANDNRLSVMFNDGVGGYGQLQTLTTTDGPIQSAAARLDGNITTDIATVDTNGGSVSVFYNDGDTSFTSTSFAVGTNPFGIAMGDLNHDGWNDIAISLISDNLAKVYWNDGAGNFNSGNFAQYVIPDNPRGIVLEDFDGINGLDIAVSTVDGDSVHVLLNTGLGVFEFHPSSPFAVGDTPIHIDTGDLDADGDVDIVAAALNDGALDVLINDGSGGFTLEGQFNVMDFPRSVSVADFDGDGVGDIITGSSTENTISILQNLRSGIAYWSGPGNQFDNAVNWFGGLSPEENPLNVVVFDQSIGGMVPDQFPTLSEDESFQGLGLASLNVNLNLAGNNLDLYGDQPAGQNALVLGLRQAGPGALFPPFGTPTLSLQNTTPSVISTVTSSSLVVGEAGPAELKLTVLGELLDLRVEESVVVGLRGEGVLDIRGGSHHFYYGDPDLVGESIVIGSGATGTVHLSNGAIVNEGLDQVVAHNGVDRFVLGQDEEAVGIVNITGGGQSNSLWSHKGESFIIGDSGAGHLHIESGGVLSTTVSSIVLAAGASSSAEVVIDGTGSVWVDPSGTLNMGSGGTSSVEVKNGALLDMNSVRNLSNGTLSGDGTLSAIVVNYGDIVVGDAQISNPTAAQTLTIEGELRQYFDPTDVQLSGRIFLDIVDENGSVSSDKICVIGDAFLGGSLVVSSAEPLDLEVGAVIPVIECTTPIEDFRFDVVLLPSLADGKFFRLIYDDQSLATPQMQGNVALVVDSLSDIELGVPSNFTPNGVPSSAMLGDLNNDLFDDLAIVFPDEVDPEFNDGQLVILLNAQSGESASNWPGLTGGTLVLSTPPNPTDLDIGDFDLQRGNDIVVSSAGGALQVYTNSGASAPFVGFDSPQVFQVDLSVEAVHVSDLNSDGFVDVVVAGSELDTVDGKVGTLLNAGVVSDTWIGLGSSQLFQVGQRPVDIDSADLDMQNGVDLAVANFDSDSVSLLRNLGSDVGVWNGFDQSAEIQVGSGPSFVFTSDLDEEKDLDLVVVNQTEGTLSVVLQNGMVGSELSDLFSGSASFPVGDNPQSAVLWDSDSDGDQDMAFVVENENGTRIVRLIRNLVQENAESGFPGLSYVVDQDVASENGPLFVLSGQLNADKGDDLSVIGETPTLPLGIENSGFGTAPIGLVYLGVTLDCRADLTGDGDLNFLDVSAFLSAFGSGESSADFTGDGLFNFLDVSAFLLEFANDCI